MVNNYYIQVGSDPYKDIYADYGVKVKSTEGLNDTPDGKKVWSRDWKDEQGLDVYLPTYPKFKERKIKITFLLHYDTLTEMKEKMRVFLSYLFSANELSYFDTFKSEGFRGYYSKEKIQTESYRAGLNMIEFDMEFIAPNGICYGFDSSENDRISLDVINGTADLYFSDGTSLLGVDEALFMKFEGKFIIVCPSIYGGVVLSGGESRMMLDRNSRLFISRDERLFIT